MKLEAVSVTELATFRECRRAWYLEYVRELAPRTPIQALWFGTLIHTGLEGYYREGRSLQHALIDFDAAYQESLPKLEEGFGLTWESAAQEFLDAYQLGREMLTNYAEYEPMSGAEWTVTSLEDRVAVPIKSANGRSALKGSPKLKGRMDMVVTTPEGLVIVDHKTASGPGSVASGRILEQDDQLTGYAYIFWRLTGDLPRYLVYDVLLKKPIKEPRVNKDGKLSVDKAQGTSYNKYLAKINEMGLNPAHYEEMLQFLLQQGWKPWFIREGTSRNMEQILNYQYNLYLQYAEMREVAKDSRKAYPSPSLLKCQRCQFQSVCIAMDDGTDAESIIENSFSVGKEHQW